MGAVLVRREKFELRIFFINLKCGNLTDFRSNCPLGGLDRLQPALLGAVPVPEDGKLPGVF